MGTMQNTFNKIALLVLAGFALSGALQALPPETELSQADALFAEKKFTQSLEVYRKVFSQGYRSPAMLLRMAYIEEGLQHPAYALYYLNLAYSLFPDARIWQKMTDLAARHKATGYEQPLWQAWYAHYAVRKDRWIGLNLALAVALAIVVVLSRRRSGISRGLGVVQIVTVALLFLQLNLNAVQYAIVVSDNTPVMGAPSAAGGVKGSVTAGCRLRVLGRQDVWVKVSPNAKDEPGYVRISNLLLL